MDSGGVCTALLVVSLTAIASTGSTSVPVDTSVCHKRPFGIIVEYLKCDRLSQWKILSNRPGHSRKKAELLDFVRVQCTEVTDRAIACFHEKIRGCNSRLQSQLNDLLATGVGFLCQPGGIGVEPVMNYVAFPRSRTYNLVYKRLYVKATAVMNSISDDDFEQTKVSMCRVNVTACYELLNTRRSTLSLDALIRALQSARERFARCIARKFQAAQPTCPHWRAEMLVDSIGPVFGDAFIGLRLPFSQQEMADMFQI